MLPRAVSGGSAIINLNARIVKFVSLKRLALFILIYEIKILKCRPHAVFALAVRMPAPLMALFLINGHLKISSGLKKA